MTKRITILILAIAMLFGYAAEGQAQEVANETEEAGLDVKELIFEHLGDGYGWEVPFSHTKRIPLPVIVKSEDGQWFCFSSSELLKEEEIEHGEESKVEMVPQIKTITRGDKEYQFVLAHISSNKDKVVEIFPMTSEEESVLQEELSKEPTNHSLVVPGYVKVAGEYYREYRPLDLSITKNVLALFISAFLVALVTLSLVRFYKRNGLKAPRRGMGFFEMLVSFVYYDTIKSTLKENTSKFAPYLLTCFFFILTMNLVGLIVIFPGGANLTGNIAITLVLALMTFVITNLFGTKHYWKDIFWPDVPVWLKCPLPIMQLIEVFGIFTKPAALCVRLFANMMGGHIIVITLTLLIFIFAAFGSVVAGGATVVSVAFSIFMLLLDVLVSFIQAYVFTLLSALFIGMAQEHGHHTEEAVEE